MRARLFTLVSIFALGAVAAGCKKDPDQALVVFDVQVEAGVGAFTSVNFSVETPKGVPPRHHTGTTPTFTFGYYMPGVSGAVKIIGDAVDATGCVVGTGSLPVDQVKAGIMTRATMSLVIKSIPANCARDGGGGQGGGGQGGPGGAGGKDAAPTDGEAGDDGGDAGGNDGGPGAKTELGLTCTADSDCASGYCVDGVCCESACTGSCEACGEPDTKGQCVAVSGAPRPKHTACAGAGTPCVGTCDGANRSACTYPAATQPCRAASCTASMATLAANCDGKGACPVAQTVSCGTNACAGTICSGGCSDTSPCPAGNYCAGGVCMPKKTGGQTCTAVGDCASGFCVDGVCCDKACTGACTACNLTGLVGTCSPVKSGVDDMCSGMSSCDATGTCKKASGQTCTTAADCTSGNCVDGHCCGTATCAACHACTGGGGTCVAINNAEDADSCSGTKSCDATGMCKLKPGQTCTAGTQCASGFCADGVCCNVACGGACEACAETTKGTCVAVTGAPRAGHTACVGAGTCAGSCDGTNRAACGYPGATTSCRTASCTGGMATAGANCDGKGACPAIQMVNCAPNSCSGTACAGGCSASQPCVGANYCLAGTCTAKKSSGMACGSKDECTSGNCVDGTCCGVASCGSCQACTGTGGTCVAVKNADDDTCTGTSSCDASGVCKKKQGQPCTAGTDCLKSNCADGICCDAACTGACQYCNSAGTCSLTTGAPKPGHGSCSGTGSCQGTCTGSSATCTPQSTSTMCQGAMCSADGTSSTPAAFCNSSGNCGSVATTKCNAYACNTSSGACYGNCTSGAQCSAGSLCNGGQCQTCQSPSTICGTSCVNLQTDRNHCGACTGRVCGSSTPACVQGSCVECSMDSDCTTRGLGYTKCDTTQNACLCAQKSGSNRITGGGFDDQFLSGWGYDSRAVSYSTDDYSNCPKSGSAKIISGSPNSGTLIQCVGGVTGGVTYTLGFRYKQDTPNTAYCLASYFTDIALDGSCMNPAGPDFFAVQGGTSTSTTSWSLASASQASDPGTRYIGIQCNPIQGGTMWLDQVYLTQGTSGSF